MAPYSTTTKAPATTPDKQAGNKSLVVTLSSHNCRVFSRNRFSSVNVVPQFGLAQSSSIYLHSTLFSVQPRQGVYSQ